MCVYWVNAVSGVVHIAPNAHVLSRQLLSPLAQAAADGLATPRLESSAGIGFEQTSAGGCFKQGRDGRFVRKAKTTEHTRYVPTYNAQIAEGLRSFRPKQNVVDLQRSNSLLQRSLQSQRLQFSALQAQKAAPVLTARGHCEVAKSLVVEKQLSNTRRLRSAQF